MSEDKERGAASDLAEAEPTDIDKAPADDETQLARRMFIRAGLVAPLALAAFTVDRPARAAATCQPQWCSPGDPCNPVLCGPQICSPFDD
ncbi:MAG: hypothetical protein JRF63_09465 [Deltaproteobacteria bacterium]|nr:hypothetical protein [Deltaproteobacteria bacterium]